MTPQPQHCEHDTRSRPAPSSAPEISVVGCTNDAEEPEECFNHDDCDDCPYWSNEPELDSISELKATIRNETLDELKNAFRIADEDSCGFPWTKLQIIKLIDEYQESLRREVPE